MNLKINGMTNKIWTFRKIREHSILMAKTLHGAGIRRNDVISIVSENRHEVSAIAYGAFCLNAIVAPINVTYTERKICLPSGRFKVFRLSRISDKMDKLVSKSSDNRARCLSFRRAVACIRLVQTETRLRLAVCRQ